MKTEKLFNVLVVGASMLIASSAISGDVNAGGGWHAFCDPNDEELCIEGPDGGKVEREGVICCWGTSCDDVAR